MKKLYVPYDLALSLERLGISMDYILGYYNRADGERSTIYEPNRSTIDKFLPVPLWDQIFDWFELEQGLSCWVSTKTVDGGDNVFIPHGRTIPDTIKNNLTVDLIPYFTYKTSYEAKRFCLEKLIEIFEKRNSKK